MWLLGLLLSCHSRVTVGVEPDWKPIPPPADDSIYFVLVDRFDNGDTSNDGEIDLTDPHGWHGGDLAGVLDRLDHIEALGFRTVWLSPIWSSRRAPFHGWGAFHGYWVEDPRQIDPHFGDIELLAELSSELHSRDMRLVLDVVYNHLAPEAALLEQHPDWVHGLGGIEDWDDPEEVVTHDVHGLPDLAVEMPEVSSFLHGASLDWIRRARPDGFRVDAVRHLPESFLEDTAELLRMEAPGFELLGELFEGDATKLAVLEGSGRFDRLFDFPLHYAMLDVLCGDAPVGRLAAALSADRFYVAPQRLVTFLDNHDLPRVAGRCGGDTDRVKAALRFLFSVRGVPCVSWATELAPVGMREPANRLDMDFAATQPLGPLLSELQQLRREHPALHSAHSAVVFLDESLMLLARGDHQDAALVAVNTSAVARTVPPVPGFAFAATWEVAARSVAVRTGFRWHRPAGPAPERSVTLRATGVPEGAKTVVFAGSGPELGSWHPGQAPALHSDGEDWFGVVQVPAGTVLEGKLVIGSEPPRWQEGANHAFLVREDQVVAIPWVLEPVPLDLVEE
jgi:glycosidase